MADYYNSDDLKNFPKIGKFKEEFANKFFDYYNSVTGSNSSLTKREKILIALAVAHSQKCPYCIDAFTVQALENGLSPDEMTEAVHTAAAMDAGITLVHGIQMQNTLKRHGAL